MPDDVLSPPEISDFLIRLVQDAEAIHRRFAVSAAILSYPKAEIRALAVARTMLDEMCERRQGKRTDILVDGIAAIAEIRTGAKAVDDVVKIIVTALSVTRLRECFRFFIEYEVLWEKDRTSSPKRWRR